MRIKVDLALIFGLSKAAVPIVSYPAKQALGMKENDAVLKQYFKRIVFTIPFIIMVMF